MKRPTIVLAIGTALASLFFGLYPITASTPSNADLKKRLAECKSIPNGSTLDVVQTTRLFIFLPKEYYPHIKLIMTSKGATAGSVSNAGAYGYAQSFQPKLHCWSYYFDFELTPKNKTQSGTVDIGSKSAFTDVSNYLIHFTVFLHPPAPTKRMSGNGTVKGVVLLGPVCPVEHIPPDPACAPRPYQTTIDVWSTLTGNSYKRISTNASGVFNLSLSPGPYALAVSPSADGSPYPRCTDLNFSVAKAKTRTVTVNCDTGIR